MTSTAIIVDRDRSRLPSLQSARDEDCHYSSPRLTRTAIIGRQMALAPMIEAMSLATPPLRIRLFAAAHHMANAEVVRSGACLEEVNGVDAGDGTVRVAELVVRSTCDARHGGGRGWAVDRPMEMVCS